MVQVGFVGLGGNSETRDSLGVNPVAKGEFAEITVERHQKLSVAAGTQCHTKVWCSCRSFRDGSYIVPQLP